MYFLAVDQIETAQAALNAGRLIEARTILEARGGDAQALALLARVYHQLKLPKRGLLAAQQAERLGQALPAVQHALALYYAQSGQRRLAANWEGRFAQSPVADPAAALRAALLFAEVKQWKDALTFGRLALTKQDRPEVRSLLARAAEALGQPEEAVKQHRALLALLPEDEAAHAEFGQALLRMAKFGEAATFLEEAQRKFDKSAQIELALGVAYYSQRRFAEAGGRFLRVIDIAPAVPQPYIFLAKMIDQLPNQIPEIRARAETWYRQEPVNGYAPFVYARALQAAGAADGETKPLLLEAIRRDGTVWEFPFELGQLLERERDFSAAARAYEASLLDNERIPETHYRLARVYDRLQQPAKAERERARHKQLLGGGKEGEQ